MAEDIKLTIPTNFKYLTYIRMVADSLISSLDFTEIERGRMVMSIDEATSNVIKYSCKDDLDQTFSVTFTVDDGGIEIRIRDFGEAGKDYDIENDRRKDFEEVRGGGFGVNIIKAVMDEVKYSSSPEEGNLFYMSKKVGG